ncbi:hypothetical protein E5288_WYG012641 [Bos mutus]|uniref:Uncharacterized protein n=1 Tax=Bos mutus TaxID=72004 RepID=A0A6B0QUA8_9CETA|nr:hypothetical protein [Bos mutus]
MGRRGRSRTTQSSGRGDRGQPSGRNLGAAREEWDPGPKDSGARPGPAWTLGGASEVVAATPASAQGQSPSRRGAHLRPPWELPKPPPHPASIAQGRWSPPSLGFEPSPGFPGALGPAVPGGRTKRLLAEDSGEYRAVEQVVPEMEIGKPVVSSSEVSLVRKWAFPPDQPALIQTYRMPRERSLELPGEGWDRKDLVSTPVQLGENKPHND